MLSLAAHDPSAVGQVRREADRLASAIGIDAEARSRLALVCNEAVGNLVLHGGGGEVLLGTRERRAGPSVELVALDRGPGIADLAAARVDGHSGAGTSGHGLGALERQSDELDVHSVPGLGTALLARVGRRDSRGCADGRADGHGDGDARADVRRTLPASALTAGAVRVARRGERRCGDGWRVRIDRDGCALCLVDGLGHGEGAAQATDAALAAFDGCAEGDARARIAAMHTALRGTRGAVAAVMVGRFDPASGAISFEHASVGNIAAAACRPGERPRRLYAVEGVLGRGEPVPKVERLELAGRTALVMHSDGVRAPATFERRGGLLRRDPALVAAVLYRDGGDRRDDCAVLVARAASLDRHGDLS